MGEAVDEVYSSLRKQFQGDLLRPADAEYDAARGIWNGMLARKPGLMARCVNVSDIQSAIRAAAAANVLTAIRCGGHSLAGFSTCDDGMVIDLTRMREVAVDPAARRARAAGGCLLGSIDIATQKAGLVFPAGVVSHTGASGLILGGGTGWLTRFLGLSIDNVAGFTLVTADGSVVRANERENSDLFWALRGGGGNFGVVTEFELKLHPLTSVVLGEGLTAGDNIGRVLKRWRDFMPDAPEELKWNISLRLAHDADDVPAEVRGRPVASHALVWAGDLDQGRSCVARALAICDPKVTHTKVASFLELQTMADHEFPHGLRYYTKSGYFTQLEDSSIEQMVGAVQAIPSAMNQVELAYLGGAAARVGAAETAFGDRSAPFIMNLLGSWSAPDDDAANISWVRGLFNDLRPAMKPGVYINFMSADEENRVPEAYQERWQRLVAVKSHYDPGNFFRLNQNIPPQRSAAERGDVVCQQV